MSVLRLLAVLAALAPAVLACSSQGDGANARGPLFSACATASSCESGTCLTFRPNKQGTAGVCTQECVTVLDCPSGSVCAATNVGSICLRSCSAVAPCAAGFACVYVDAAHRACGVEPGTPLDGGECNQDVRGSCFRPGLRECHERAGESDATLASDKAACRADVAAIWSDGPCPILDNLGGCRRGCAEPETTWYYGPAEDGTQGKLRNAEEVRQSCSANSLTYVTQ